MCCRDTKSIGQWRAVVCRANAYAKLRFSYEMGKPLGRLCHEPPHILRQQLLAVP